MALLVAGRHRAVDRAWALGTPYPAVRRVVAPEERRRRRRGRQRRDQHGGVRRGRGLAPLARPPRPGLRAGDVADRTSRPRLRVHAAAALRRHRVVAGVVGRRAGERQPRGAAGRLVEHPPRSPRRAHPGRAARRPAAGVGADDRPARACAPRAPRPVPRQVELLDGLVLPGARWRRTRRGRRCAAPQPMERLRGARARRPLRRHRPLGHRCRDLRAGAGARRAGRPRPGPAAVRRRAAPAAGRGRVLDRLRLPGRRALAGGAHHLHDGGGPRWPTTRSPTRRRVPTWSAAPGWWPIPSRWRWSAAAPQPTPSPAVPDLRRRTRSEPTASTSAKLPEPSARR